MICELKAGRELDALVEQELFGNNLVWINEQPYTRQYVDQRRIDSIGMCADGNVPRYSTDIKAAWEVVEKLKLLERFSLTLQQLSPTNTAWTLSDLRDGEPIAWSETAPHAICLAALKAVNK